MKLINIKSSRIILLIFLSLTLIQLLKSFLSYKHRVGFHFKRKERTNAESNDIRKGEIMMGQGEGEVLMEGSINRNVLDAVGDADAEESAARERSQQLEKSKDLKSRSSRQRQKHDLTRNTRNEDNFNAFAPSGHQEEPNSIPNYGNSELDSSVPPLTSGLGEGEEFSSPDLDDETATPSSSANTNKDTQQITFKNTMTDKDSLQDQIKFFKKFSRSNVVTIIQANSGFVEILSNMFCTLLATNPNYLKGLVVCTTDMEFGSSWLNHMRNSHAHSPLSTHFMNDFGASLSILIFRDLLICVGIYYSTALAAAAFPSSSSTGARAGKVVSSGSKEYYNLMNLRGMYALHSSLFLTTNSCKNNYEKVNFLCLCWSKLECLFSFWMEIWCFFVILFRGLPLMRV